MEGRDEGKPFRTWSAGSLPAGGGMASMTGEFNPLALVIGLLNDDSVRKFYQNDVLEIPERRLANYNDITQIRAGFDSCERVNDPSFDPQSVKEAVFFILRSTCDDDIHKAIKYSYWTSTTKTNQQLNDSYHYCQRRGIPLYLVFTVVSSKQFCGVAEMRSPVQFNKIFNYWWEEVKWSGVFRLQWLYIKDLHHEDVRDVCDGELSVVQMKDGSRVSFQSGLRLLAAFRDCEFVSDIFEEFERMDHREEKLRFKRDGFLQVVCQLKARGVLAPPDWRREKRLLRRESDPSDSVRYFPKS